MNHRPVLTDINNTLPSLRKSEIKVAEYVLKHAQHVIHMRIVDLAQEAQVSEPTIVRFCRAIGCNGFQEFKVRIAQEMALSNNIGHFAIEEDDSIDDVCTKVSDTTISRLQQVKAQLNKAQINQVAKALSQANRVEFYGYGSSGAVAVDAQHKFFRLQIATTAYSDPHMQAMSAVTLSSQDVVVAISQSGRSKDLIHCVELAQKAGAVVVSLAPSHSPLSRLADFPIDINVEENIEQFTPMTSRIAYLMVIDILAVSVTHLRGPEFSARLTAIKKSLQPLYLESDY